MADTRKIYIKTSYDISPYKYGIHSYKVSDLSYITGTSTPSNLNTTYLTLNEDYLFTALSSGTERFFLHDKDLNLVQDNNVAGTTIYDICTDGTYYYLARYITSGNYSLEKYNATGTLITSVTGITASSIRALTISGGYLYFYTGGDVGDYYPKLEKRNASDLSYVTSVNFSDNLAVNGILVIGSYLYHSLEDYTGRNVYVYKRNINDLSVAASKTYSSNIYTYCTKYGMSYDSDYVYMLFADSPSLGDTPASNLRKFDYDLNEVNNLIYSGASNTPYAVSSGDYIYIIDYNVDKTIKKYRKSDFSYVSESSSPPLLSGTTTLNGLLFSVIDGSYDVPDVPTGLTVSNIASTSFDLNWVNNETVFNDGNYVQVLLDDNWTTNGIVSSGDTSYTITGLTSGTTYYVRVGVLYDSELFFSSSITGTTKSAISAGTIAAAQTICYLGNPALITSTANASGGVSPYYYQWQYSTNSGGTWTDLVGENGTTYDPSTLTATRWYRRKVTDSDSPAETAYSNTVIVTVYPALNAGTIAAAQTIVSGTAPALLTTTVAPSGGNPSGYTLQWQNSLNDIAYSNIGGASNETYQPPSLTVDTWYRKRVTNSCGTEYTASLKITIMGDPVFADVDGSGVRCHDDCDGVINFYNQSGGSGTYEYSIDSGATWQSTSGYTGVCSGYYYCYVRDANETSNVYYSGSLDFPNPDLIDADVVIINCTSNGSSDGQIIVSGITGGHPNYYEVSIDSGATWQSTLTYDSIQYLSKDAGTYSVWVRDRLFHNCTVDLGDFIIAEPSTSLPPPFCYSVNYSLVNSTCNNSDGNIIINAPYVIYYDFSLTDTFGNSYSIVGSTFTVPSGYYTLTATPKPAYAYAYSTCSIGWVAISDTDTTMTLTPVVRGSTSSYLISQGTGDARIYCDWSDSVSGLTHDHYLYKANGENILTVTGTTGTSDFVKTPVTNGDYYAILINENGCKKLSGLIKVDFIQSPFNLGGVKRVFITEYNDNLNPIFWKTSDEDYFVQSLDLLKFQSAKLKYLSGTTTWYSITTDTDTVFTQSIEKVRQGFIFRNKLTITFSPSAYYKWVATKELLTKRFCVVFEDCNGNWWIFGYTNEGAEVNVYTRKSDVNAYALEFASNAGDKILTAIDYNNYVLPVIINS